MGRFHGQNGLVVACQAHELLGIFPLSCVQNSGEPQGCLPHLSVIQDITGSGKHHHACLPTTVGLRGCQFCWHLLEPTCLPASQTPCLRTSVHLISSSVLQSLTSPQWPPSPRLMGFSTDGERWPRTHRATFPGDFFSFCRSQAAPCILARDDVVQGAE